MKEMLLLVDENDNIVGEMEKLETHQKGLLHRAFSGFVFNDKNELLIQQRASCKYHNANIWSNTVCSHSRRNESIEEAVKRRCKEELGFVEDFTELQSFIYKVEFPNGLTENEFDHVCVAKYSGGDINMNKYEVQNYKWISRKDLIKDIEREPEKYSFWLKEILKLHILDEYYK